MIRSLLFVTLLLAISHSGISQKDFFKDIREFDSLSSSPKLLYFHFDGCPPCKKMDEQVLSKPHIREVLRERFELYSVYNFEEYEKKVRKKYGNKGNPEFVILDSNNQVNHRFVGFHDPPTFIEQLDLAFSSESFSQLEKEFRQLEEEFEGRKGDFQFFKRYMKAKEDVMQVDSSLIFEYFDVLLEQPLSKEIVREIAHYGYDPFYRNLKYGSEEFMVLADAYHNNRYPELNDRLRTRLVISMNSQGYETDDPVEKERIIEKLKEVENGELNIIKGMYDGNTYAFLPNKYPSFDFEYELASKGKERLELLNRHLARIGDDAQELNRIAWAIYTGDYEYDPEKGIELITKALDISRKYHYLDTYAALLYKKGDYEMAKKQAEKAIALARKKDRDHDETLDLLEKINAALEK